MAKLVTVPVSDKALALCDVKVERAEDLDRDQTSSLMAWCDCQTESLWDDMTLQEILNVYRVSAEWDTFECWTQEEGDVARKAWNRVVRPQNRLRLLSSKRAA